MLRFRLAIAIARIAFAASRLFRRGGTALPGLVALKVDPRLIEKLAASLADGVVVVTGTNGKTTTAKMITTMLEGSGRSVLANRAGSNLARGVATSLIIASRRARVDKDVAVLEIDEAAVRELGPLLRPRLLVVTNLARDQLDRYGELDATAAHIAVALASSGGAVLNADDTMVAALAGDTDPAWFGATPDIRDTMPDDHTLYGREAKEQTVRVDSLLTDFTPTSDGQTIRLTVRGEDVEALLQVPGVYNGYNAAAALLAVSLLGLDPVDAAADLAAMPPAFGRGQVIPYRERLVRLLLVKNPAGLNQAIRVLCGEPGPIAVLIAINDNHADGRDVSWLWDARLEDLSATPHRYGAGGVRATDMALRLKYAGVSAWTEPDDRKALARVVDDAAEGATVYVIPTYTAMLSFLELLLPGVPREEAWL